MYEELIQKTQGYWDIEDLELLEEIETTLQFDSFSVTDAMSIGRMFYEEGVKQEGESVFCVVREADENVIVQIIGDSKAQRNIGFAMGKRNTVLATGHSSLWAMVKKSVTGECDVVFDEGSTCLPAGGAYPVYVNGEHKYTLATSGLHNGLDHLVLIDVLSKYVNKPVPKWDKPAI